MRSAAKIGVTFSFYAVLYNCLQWLSFVICAIVAAVVLPNSVLVCACVCVYMHLSARLHICEALVVKSIQGRVISQQC